MSVQVPAPDSGKFLIPVESVQLPAVILAPAPDLEHWLGTVSNATNGVLRDMAQRTRTPELNLALLQAIDGASEALQQSSEGVSALKLGLNAALKTARATSIVVHTFDAKKQGDAELLTLIAEIARIERASREMSAGGAENYLRAALKTLVPPLRAIDPGMAEVLATTSDFSFVGRYANADFYGALAAVRTTLAARCSSPPSAATSSAGADSRSQSTALVSLETKAPSRGLIRWLVSLIW